MGAQSLNLFSKQNLPNHIKTRDLHIMATIVNTVKNTIAENFGGTHSLASKANQFSLAAVPDQSHKVAVITGGSRGIGYACAHTLLEKNIEKLFIIGSTKESLDGTSSDIASTLGSSYTSKVKFLQADMSDWKSIPGIAKQITDSTDRLDILINCAARGIMTYQLTPYGVDRHMAVNHMGHVILTSHLLPLIKSTAKKHPEDKVRLVMFCATASEEGGLYVCPPAIPEEGSKVYQDESGEVEGNLMKLTLDVVGEKVDPKSQGCPMQLY